ncbi:TPA: hypothetical protein R9B53_004478 [Escherichia coli]|nr:hypothetical protein [Escherichia coli]
MTDTDIPGAHRTPVFDDSSRLILDLSFAGQATLTAFATGITPDSLTLTYHSGELALPLCIFVVILLTLLYPQKVRHDDKQNDPGAAAPAL